MSMTFQPKARHLAGRSPSDLTDSTVPSSWMPLTSTMAQTLSRPWAAAVMAASQIWPSWLSPSPIMT